MNLVLLFLSIVLLSVLPLKANNAPDPAVSYFLKEIDARMVMTTDLPTFPKDKKTVVSTTFDPKTGAILSARIKNSCDMETLDFGCMEASYALAPLAVRTGTEKYNLELSFPPRDFQPNWSLPQGSYLIHVIPLTVAFLYPEIYSKGELEKPSNIASLKAPRHYKVLRAFYLDWFKFFRSHKTATREDIEQQAALMLKKHHLGTREKAKAFFRAKSLRESHGAVSPDVRQST